MAMDRSDMVAGLAEQFMTNWTSDVFRNRCVAQIESVRCNSQPQKTSTDPVEQFLADNTSRQLEEFVFSKSQTREDYVALIAEMMMMLRQHVGKPLVDEAVLAAASPEELEAAGVSTSTTVSTNGQAEEPPSEDHKEN